MPNLLVMTPVLGCGLTRAHDRDASRNTVSPRPSDFFCVYDCDAHVPLVQFCFSLSLSSVVSFSLSLSCTLPRTTDRDLDVLTSFHLAQGSRKQVVICCHLRNPSSYCPTTCSVSIDPRSLHGSRMHSEFTRRCSLHLCHGCQGS